MFVSQVAAVWRTLLNSGIGMSRIARMDVCKSPVPKHRGNFSSIHDSVRIEEKVVCIEPLPRIGMPHSAQG